MAIAEDCVYIETRLRRAEKRIVLLMQQYPNDQMTYTHNWVLLDEENAQVIFRARTHMPDLGDGHDYSTTNWSMIDYAGKGQQSREEAPHISAPC